MKKFAPALGIVLFPYAVAFLLYCLFSGFLMDSVFQNNALAFLPVLAVLWAAGLACAVWLCAASLGKKWDPVEVSRANMLVKLCCIPAYLVIFVVGAACLLTIFTFGITLILAILDGLALLLSGIFGLAAVKRCHDGKALSTAEAVLCGILQFIFCADVVAAVLVFRRAKKRGAGLRP